MFCLGPNGFGRVQLILFRFKLDFSGLIFIIWTRPKQNGPVQNDWYSTEMIWTVQNNFGPIEGQGIRISIKNFPKYCYLGFHFKKGLGYMIIDGDVINFPYVALK